MRRAYLFVAVLSVLAAVSSCSTDREGIFFSLENEVKARDNTLDNGLIVPGVVKSGAYYFAAAGSVFFRRLDGTDWDRIDNPMKGALVSDIVVDPADSAHMLVSMSDGSRNGVYRLDSANKNYISGNLYAQDQVTRLFAVNGEVFAAVGREPKGLRHWDGLTFVGTDFPTNTRPLGMTWDGTDYWVVSSADIFVSSNETTGWSTPDHGPESLGMGDASGYQDIYYDSGAVFVSSGNDIGDTTDQQLAKFTLVPGQWVVSGEYNYQFNYWGKVAGQLVVGTDGDGYGHVNPGADATVAPSFNQDFDGNFSRIPDLYTAPVASVFVDGDSLFLGTVLRGLWLGDYANPAEPEWNQE